MRPLQVTFVALGTEQLAISQMSALAKRDGHNVTLAFSASLFHDRFNLEFPSIAPFFDDTKKVINKIKLDSTIYQTPVYANGVLYVASETRLYAIPAMSPERSAP